MLKKRTKILLFFFLFLWGATFALKSQAAALGEIVNFNVDAVYDSAGRGIVGSTLRLIGERAIFYVEDIWWNALGPDAKAETMSKITALKDEFDKTIYPRMNAVFGSEWSPGIDNDYRISILVTKMKDGTGGYFNSDDEYPKTQVSTSNEREMIYLNASYLELAAARSFLAHEFQHLISYYQKEIQKGLSEEVWLNEARSEYASTVCGFDDIYAGSNLERRVNEFLRDPSDSLTVWENKTEDYGAVNLFMQYLAGRYSQSIVTKIIKADSVGIASINEALASAGLAEKFPEIFTNWTIANYLNTCQFGDGQKFCYFNPFLNYARFHLNPTAKNILNPVEGEAFNFSDNLGDWSARWYQISAAGSGFNLALNFSSAKQSKFQIPLLIFYTNGGRSLKFFNFTNFQAAELINDFGGNVASVVIIPSAQNKLSNFTQNDPVYGFSYLAKITSSNIISLSDSTQAPAFGFSSPPAAPLAKPNYPDGSLIRAKGDYRVYVIKGNYKRWLQSPEIFSAYPHLGWQNVIEVTVAERDWYREASLVRADGDYRVYEINGDLSKHWLNMTAVQFAISGRMWDMVFIVNQAERDLYKTGAAVMR